MVPQLQLTPYGQALPVNTITVTSVVNPNDAALALAGRNNNPWNSIDVLPTTGTNPSYCNIFTI